MFSSLKKISPKLLINISLGIIFLAGIFFITTHTVHASIWDNLQKQLADGRFELEDISQLMLNLVDLALTFTTYITLIVMIVGGYLYIAAQGNPDNLEKAKKTITGAVIAFIIIIISKAIVTFLENGLRQFTTSTNLIAALVKVIDLMLLPLGFIAALGLIGGGYQYIMASGSPDKIEKAKKTILYSVIGLVLTILSAAILYFICDRFGLGCK
jgi:hypothetical protein